MIDRVKKVIQDKIGYGNYRKMLTTVGRKIYMVDKKIMRSACIKKQRKYAVDGKDTFFGYYDLNSIDQNCTKLLSHVLENDQVAVGYFDIDSGIFHQLSMSAAWNWQMGARLRWFVDGDQIMFNDFDGEKFISRVVDIKGREIRRFPFPIFDYRGKDAYFTDFTVLHHLREGYGYPNKNIADIYFDDYYENCENGVYYGNMDTGEIRLLISMEWLLKEYPISDLNVKYHYVNHITVNPDNGDVMFFHLWTNNRSSWKNRMVFVDKNGTVIRIIDDYKSASHYSWCGGNRILVTGGIGNTLEYRLYNYRDGSFDKLSGVNTDGHPSFLNERFIVADTYPNRSSMQSVFLFDIKENLFCNIFSVYHVPEKIGPFRCDLHPRVQGSMINIDSVPKGKRVQYILTIDTECKEYMRWIGNLPVNSQAYIGQNGSHKGGLLANLDAEYLFASGRLKGNKLKELYSFLFQPTFQINVLINQMQGAGKLRKRKISNYLARRCGVDISPDCKIGCHFRIDHPYGIVIAANTEIGDYCKIFQNVTLGRRNGGYPTIGNHVTIFAGAKVLGPITIGDNATIGANAVVISDVPPGATAVGVPARIIRKHSAAVNTNG